MAIVAGLSVAKAAGTAPSTGCFADWSSASPVVRSEVLTPVRDILAHARALGLGEVMRVTLCRDDGRYVYRLLVRAPSGLIAPLTVDARKPF